LTFALICEVADTPTGVVMIGYQGIRVEQKVKSLKKKIKEENSWQK